jgi:hypothetical protein
MFIQVCHIPQFPASDTGQFFCFSTTIFLFCFWRHSPQWAKVSSFMKFLVHTQRRTTVGRTPLDDWSARRRDLFLTTHNAHRQISVPPPPPVRFEPTISGGERSQTYALDRVATGTSSTTLYLPEINNNIKNKSNNNILTINCHFSKT